MEYKKNKKIVLEIIDMTDKGLGVAKIDSRVFFVEKAVIGDIVEALILKVTKNIIYTKTIKYIVFSKLRENYNENVHDKCGTCTMFLLNYKSQLDYKKKMVENNLSRIAKINYNITDIVESVDKTHYRNKSIYPLAVNDKNEIIYGSYAINSHRIINNKYCLIQKKEVDDLMFEISKLIKKHNISIYNENTQKGLLKNIFFRISEYFKEISLTFIINGDNIDNNFIEECKKFNSISSISININKNNSNTLLSNNTKFLYGNEYIKEKIGDLIFKIHPNSFFQVNTKTCKLLYDKIIELASFSQNDTVLDLFSGIGSISLYISKYVKEVKGIEIINFATNNANENMILNRVNNVLFETKNANKIKDELNNYSYLIVDPPRKGLDEELIYEIKSSKIEKIIYVSCDSATLSRDLNLLKEKFIIEKISIIDMFPQTHHIETVVLMSRKDK